MFGKFFSCAFTGSMAGAGTNVFAVWGFVIANAVDSQVEVNPKIVAAMLGCEESEVQAALDYLCQPDPLSRSREDEGRRLVKEGTFAYRVVNHETYRWIRDESDRREYNRLKKREGRSRGVNVRVKTSQTHNGKSIRESSVSAQAEAEAEADKKKGASAPKEKVNSKFVKPSIEEVETYCDERDNAVPVDQWFAHYESNGWKVGRNPMKDWKAAVRTWEKNHPKPESRVLEPKDYHRWNPVTGVE